ncbi:hypothetical protein B0T25DRAFT_586345 [Lasiosphaeria hispida]|uniref:Uncharacterized protein n=1 Tax=Lasiosphaeria hispida TaxID=260671 RepID=A0AAJ0H541_9PEZI|nr:hypothetical protein B0T25DRAFT_586345 [Lasiosphaeria hispida]
MVTVPGDPEFPLGSAEGETKAQLPYSRFADISHEEAYAIFKSVQSKPRKWAFQRQRPPQPSDAVYLRPGTKRNSPRQVWFDLCEETEDVIDICRAFLEVYVKSSWRKHLSLGPQESEWAYEITCPESVNTVWKALIAEADDKILRPARQEARKKAALRGQAKIWRLKRGKHGVGTHDERVVSVIANVG